MNCKLGGGLWTVPVPTIKGGVMVVGFDVYHDTLTRGKSVGGFVASLDRNFTKYYSKTTMQTSSHEIADQLKVRGDIPWGAGMIKT